MKIALLINYFINFDFINRLFKILDKQILHYSHFDNFYKLSKNQIR